MFMNRGTHTRMCLLADRPTQYCEIQWELKAWIQQRTQTSWWFKLV